MSDATEGSLCSDTMIENLNIKCREFSYILMSEEYKMK